MPGTGRSSSGHVGRCAFGAAPILFLGFIDTSRARDLDVIFQDLDKFWMTNAELLEEFSDLALRLFVPARLDEVDSMICRDDLRYFCHGVLVDLVLLAIFLEATVVLLDRFDRGRDHVALIGLRIGLRAQPGECRRRILDDVLRGHWSLLEPELVVFIADIFTQDRGSDDSVELPVLVDTGHLGSIYLRPGAWRDVLPVFTKFLGGFICPDAAADEHLHAFVPGTILHEVDERYVVEFNLKRLESIAESGVHRVDVVFRRIRIDATCDDPTLRKFIVMNLAVGEKLHETVHDAGRTAIRLLEKNKAFALLVIWPEFRQAMLGPDRAIGISLGLGKPDEIGSFHVGDSQIEKSEVGIPFALLFDPLLHDLRFTETGFAGKKRVEHLTELACLGRHIHNAENIVWFHSSFLRL